MNPLSIGGAAVGAIGSIGSLFGAGSANRRLDQLGSTDPAYTANPIVKERLGLARIILNARNPGAAFQEANIEQNQANTLGTVQNSATSGAQLLATAAGTQAQTNQDYNRIAENDAANYNNNLSNFNGATEATVAEGDKVHQDQVRRFQDKVQIEGAKNQNRQSVWRSLSNLGFAGMNLGMAQGAPAQTGNNDYPVNINSLRPDFRTVWGQTHTNQI